MEGNLGIPKKVIHQLYSLAVSLPWRPLRDPHTTIIATTVIVILNPAHQTALNSRKRLIMGGHIQPQMELGYVELLLRGLNDCGKQSIIWDHRRWCLTYLYGQIGRTAPPYPAPEHHFSADEAQLFPNMNWKDIRKEIGNVYHTCERYPRNYHAWTYFHWLINGTSASVYRHFSEGATREDYLRVVADAHSEMRTWVERHPSDYSAIHQLCELQTIKHHLHAVGVLARDVGGAEELLSPARHCLSLLASFPSYESLWMYLRVALRDEQRTDILYRVETEFSSNQHAAKLLAWARRSDSD